MVKHHPFKVSYKSSNLFRGTKHIMINETHKTNTTQQYIVFMSYTNIPRQRFAKRYNLTTRKTQTNNRQYKPQEYRIQNIPQKCGISQQKSSKNTEKLAISPLYQK